MEVKKVMAVVLMSITVVRSVALDVGVAMDMPDMVVVEDEDVDIVAGVVTDIMT
jgi:hypothetical protein